MLVRDLVEGLLKFPQDREVVMHTSKGIISYDFADYWSGFGEINCIKEITHALDKDLIGKIKLEYLEDDELDYELNHPYEKDDGKVYIKSSISGKGNFKTFEYKDNIKENISDNMSNCYKLAPANHSDDLMRLR